MIIVMKVWENYPRTWHVNDPLVNIFIQTVMEFNIQNFKWKNFFRILCKISNSMGQKFKYPSNID